jgi:hypothetical protein
MYGFGLMDWAVTDGTDSGRPDWARAEGTAIKPTEARAKVRRSLFMVVLSVA